MSTKLQFFEKLCGVSSSNVNCLTRPAIQMQMNHRGKEAQRRSVFLTLCLRVSVVRFSEYYPHLNSYETLFTKH